MYLFLRRQELCTIFGGQKAEQTPTHLDRWQKINESPSQRMAMLKITSTKL